MAGSSPPRSTKIYRSGVTVAQQSPKLLGQSSNLWAGAKNLYLIFIKKYDIICIQKLRKEINMNFNSFDMQIQCEEFYTEEYAWVAQLEE